jgi:uncharacterized protein YwgA
MDLTNHEKIAAYIAKCESDVAASKEKIAAQIRKQRNFEEALSRCLCDAVAIINRPLLDLINDIERSRNV